MSVKFHKESFQHSLLRWFHNNERPLPWRKSYDPYYIWLSEIMLQQTQMERGVVYFEKWLERFPTIASVAAATSDEILKYWEGLGYYARARNLQKAAQIMVREHDGRVPRSHGQLLALPGVGPYTASAILSIAFNEDIVVVDANVERVFSRLFDIDKPLKSIGIHQKIRVIAEDLLVKGDARHFNQALMDLGGLLCRPKKPECAICPVVQCCMAYRGNFVEDRPIKSQRIEQIQIEMATGIVVKEANVFIQQRNDDDIWGGLWEFPGGRLKEGEEPEDCLVREYHEETGFEIEICSKVTTVVHYHTKYKVTLHCYRCRLKQESRLPVLTAAQKFHWINGDQLDNYGFPAGHRKFIDYIAEHRPEIFDQEC